MGLNLIISLIFIILCCRSKVPNDDLSEYENLDSLN